jgi:hypothetical protein
MLDPRRFGSADYQHFEEAYKRRPLVNMLVLVLFSMVVGLGLLGLVDLIKGEFSSGMKTLGAALISFVAWAALHNLALTNPKP